MNAAKAEIRLLNYQQLIAIGFLSGIFFNASASIIPGSDADFSWNTDTSTGLDWMVFDDPNAPSTLNRSFSDVSAQLQAGGEFEGWRFATRSQVNQFILNVTGLPFLVFNGTSIQQDGATSVLASITGYTESVGTGPAPFGVQGFTGDVYDSNPGDNNPVEGVYYFGLFDYFPDNRTQEFTVAVSSGVNLNSVYNGFGSWLVRGGGIATVDQPSALGLLLAFLAILSGKRIEKLDY